jgi:hypothetical protein
MGKGSTPGTLPDTFLAPALEPPPRRRWRAVLPRQVLPTAAGDENVENAVNRPPVVGPWTAGARRRWQQRPDKGPLALSQTNSAHPSRLIQSSSVSELPLGALESLEGLLKGFAKGS